MLRRIGLWVLAGAAVALFWFFYFTWLTWGSYQGGPAFEFGTATQVLVKITMPFTIFGVQNHYAITWYASLILNAACYGCIGLAWEGLQFTYHSNVARLRH